jgi:protein-S-isoprenylcysteine O-methyltransferase Ste14
MLFVPMPVTSVYFLKRDPQLVERRLRTQEKTSEQRTILRWAQFVFFGSLLIPGLDYRFGWSRVPLWLTILSQFFVFVGYLITLWVMKENSFASRTVQIDEGQRVGTSRRWAVHLSPCKHRAGPIQISSIDHFLRQVQKFSSIHMLALKLQL